MWLMVTVPIVCASGRIKVIPSLHQTRVTIHKKQIVAFGMRGAGFG